MTNFLVDEQLPPGLANWLRAQGHKAWHVHDLSLGGASDTDVAAEATLREAVIVTKDQDFVDRANLGTLHVQVIWVRIGNVTNVGLRKHLLPLWPQVMRAIEDRVAVVEVG
ncbi:MAG TPA: DUF5615 family PIN-like protein [Aestuariivirga sp.]|nr:DUF5615 family PIN-like protein [Aestuariivirga sp.]